MRFQKFHYYHILKIAMYIEITSWLVSAHDFYSRVSDMNLLIIIQLYSLKPVKTYKVQQVQSLRKELKFL